MIDNAVAAVAHAAAAEMAPRHGPSLTSAVEAAIHADGGHQEQKTPDQYIDPIALGALIVAIAQFGYQVYTDRKDRGQQPTCEAIAQAIRIERRKHSELTSEETEVIDIVSAKVIEHGGDQLPGSQAPELESTVHPGFQLSLDAKIIELFVSNPSNRTTANCAQIGGSASDYPTGHASFTASNSRAHDRPGCMSMGRADPG